MAGEGETRRQAIQDHNIRVLNRRVTSLSIKGVNLEIICVFLGVSGLKNEPNMA